MSQTTSTSAHPVDLEALRLQLKDDGENYKDSTDPDDARERLLHTLQTNDCREIIADIVNGDSLASVFVVVAYRNHVDILEAFLNHGMNIDIKNKNDWTALMYASCKGQEECVRFLLDHNASVDVQTKDGQTALMSASQFGKTKIVQMLLEKNANPDIQNSIGMTALMYASMRGYKEAVKLLLDHNPDIDLKNKSGKTALDLAKTEEIKEMMTNHVTTSYVLK